MLYAPPINLSLSVSSSHCIFDTELTFCFSLYAGSKAGIVLPIGLFHYSRK